MKDLAHLIVDTWFAAAILRLMFWWVFPVGGAILFVSLVRNITKTRRALERIADAMELPSRAGGSGILKP